jgi:hypothetical protein
MGSSHALFYGSRAAESFWFYAATSLGSTMLARSPPLNVSISTGPVERVLPLGPTTRIVVDVDGTRLLSDAAEPVPEDLAALVPGARVDVRVERAVPAGRGPTT